LGLVKKYGLGFFSSSFFLFLGFFGAEIYGWIELGGGHFRPCLFLRNFSTIIFIQLSNYIKKKSYPYKHTPLLGGNDIFSLIIVYRPELGDCCFYEASSPLVVVLKNKWKLFWLWFCNNKIIIKSYNCK
jgi:hypothetical protein